MTETDVAALLPGAALRFAALMADYLTAAPAASAAPEPSPATETPAPRDGNTCDGRARG